MLFRELSSKLFDLQDILVFVNDTYSEIFYEKLICNKYSNMVSSDGNWYDTSVSMLNFINECYKGEIEQESFKVALVNFQFKTYFDELNDVLKLGKNKLDNSEKMNKANISM